MEFALLAITFGAMYFFVIRPQQKKQKEVMALRDSLVVGDDITTIGGITGKIIAIEGDILTVETAGSTLLAFEKFAISRRNTETVNAAPVATEDTSVVYGEEQEKNIEED